MSADLHGPPAADGVRVVLGVGASRGCPSGELAALVDAVLAECGRGRAAVAAVASADVKADEPAILELADALGVPFRVFPAGELASVPVPTPSAVVAAHVGTPSVAEAAALLAAAADDPGRPPTSGPSARLLIPKRRSAHATCAVAIGAPVPSPAAAATTGAGTTGADPSRVPRTPATPGGTRTAPPAAAPRPAVPSPVPTEVPLP